MTNKTALDIVNERIDFIKSLPADYYNGIPAYNALLDELSVIRGDIEELMETQ